MLTLMLIAHSKLVLLTRHNQEIVTRQVQSKSDKYSLSEQVTCHVITGITLQYRSRFLSSLLIGSLRSLTSYSAYLGYIMGITLLTCTWSCLLHFAPNKASTLATPAPEHCLDSAHERSSHTSG